MELLPVGRDPLGQREPLGGLVVSEEVGITGDGFERASDEEDQVADVPVAQRLVRGDVGEPLTPGGGSAVSSQVDEKLDDSAGLGSRNRRDGRHEIL